MTNGFSTASDDGFHIWCNSCDGFPDSITIETRVESAVIKCDDCGETEEMQ